WPPHPTRPATTTAMMTRTDLSVGTGRVRRLLAVVCLLVVPARRGQTMHGIISKARLAAVLAASAAAIAPTTARADDAPACPSSTADAYSMTAGALTGPSKTDVTLTVEAAPGCEPATSIKHIQIKTFTADGDLAAVLNLHDRDAEDG